MENLTIVALNGREKHTLIKRKFKLRWCLCCVCKCASQVCYGSWPSVIKKIVHPARDGNFHYAELLQEDWNLGKTKQSQCISLSSH